MSGTIINAVKTNDLQQVCELEQIRDATAYTEMTR